MSKQSDFLRINEPRVERILDTIGMIEKSAASMRLPEDGAKLLQRVTQRLSGPVTGNSQSPAPSPTPSPDAAPAVAVRAGTLDKLPTQELIDQMLACALIVAARRK